MEDNVPNSGDYVEYGYDEWNRLISENSSVLQKNYTVTYEFDEASRLMNLIYPDNTKINYLYDDLGRMIQKSATKAARHE